MMPSFEFSSFLLLLFFSAFCILNTSADKALPLITVKENAARDVEDQFVLNPDAISMIKQLPSPVRVIAAIGDARVGKSTALNFIHYTLSNLGTSAFHVKNVEEIFKTGDTMAAVTRGVWISTVQIVGKHGMENVVLLDVEGTDLGDDTVTDKLSIFTALTSSSLTLFINKFPSAHILDFLYKIVRLSEEAFGKKESEHFPRLTVVLREALAPPGSYDTIDKYIVDQLVTPKWKDKSDEKRKVIGKRFARESISVFDLPVIPDLRISFQIKGNGYLYAIERLTSELLKIPEKKTLSGGLMDGQTLTDLAQRLVAVMNNHKKWDNLNPNFYYLFEKEVCRKSAMKHIQPLLGLSSQEIEILRSRAFDSFKSNCKLEEYLVYVEDHIQSTISEKRIREEREERERETRERERQMEIQQAREQERQGIKNGVFGVIGGFLGAAGYAFLAPILSDVQLKKNITLINNSEYETIGLRGVEWLWNQEAERLGLSGKESGVVAQEVEQLYPWAVAEGYDGYKRVNYSALRLLIWAKKVQRNAGFKSH